MLKHNFNNNISQRISWRLYVMGTLECYNYILCEEDNTGWSSEKHVLKEELNPLIIIQIIGKKAQFDQS
jgi:hypothetical protein